MLSLLVPRCNLTCTRTASWSDHLWDKHWLTHNKLCWLIRCIGKRAVLELIVDVGSEIEFQHGKLVQLPETHSSSSLYLQITARVFLAFTECWGGASVQKRAVVFYYKQSVHLCTITTWKTAYVLYTRKANVTNEVWCVWIHFKLRPANRAKEDVKEPRGGHIVSFVRSVKSSIKSKRGFLSLLWNAMRPINLKSSRQQLTERVKSGR